MSKSQSLLQKWKIDLSGRAPAGTASSNANLPAPPGFVQSVNQIAASSSSQENQEERLLAKRTWDVAVGPLKQTPMNIFIMYMAGNSISIFPIMMVGMMLVRPVKALLSMNSMFAALDPSSSLWAQKAVFILGQMVGLGLALYKCQSMGLLPTHTSDWLAFQSLPGRVQFSTGGEALT